MNEIPIAIPLSLTLPPISRHCTLVVVVVVDADDPPLVATGAETGATGSAQNWFVAEIRTHSLEQQWSEVLH